MCLSYDSLYIRGSQVWTLSWIELITGQWQQVLVFMDVYVVFLWGFINEQQPECIEGLPVAVVTYAVMFSTLQQGMFTKGTKTGKAEPSCCHGDVTVMLHWPGPKSHHHDDFMSSYTITNKQTLCVCMCACVSCVSTNIKSEFN